MNYSQAVSEINKIFNDKWIAESSVIATYVPEIRWNGIEKVNPPDSSKFWVYHSVYNVSDEQKTLSNNVIGGKRYQCEGIVLIQLFCPKSILNSKDKGRKLASIARNAYRSVQSEVDFKNATIKDIDPEELYYRFNVVVDYSFDEIY